MTLPGAGPADPQLVRETGLAAGFAACGLTDLAPSEHGEHLDRWLQRGLHADMAWMQHTAELRKDLVRKWTWARGALVGAVSYLTEPRDRHDAPGYLAHVARYARRDDYHDVVKRRLRDWAQRLADATGREFRSVALVDMSAVLERELAARAGVGWIGKNTCLIGEGGDSWRVLGILLVDFEVSAAARQPLAERCGSCRACLEACPTGAFPEPWVLDARRCISYLTIEMRGSIPIELRRGMGDWLFGCDVCQEVCPWNRRAKGVDDPSFDGPRSAPSLGEIARLDEREFRALFRRTPLARPKRAGLVRNALIAGANAGDGAVLEAARDLLDDESDVVRETARWAIEVGENADQA